MTAITHKQEGYSGGLNLLLDTSQLNPSEYKLMVNGRSRFGRINPVASPLRVTTGLPDGNYQGCYAVGDFGIVFVSGKAYYKDYNADGSSFLEIPGFQMSAVATQLYAVAVPASTVNFVRKIVSLDKIEGAVNLSSSVSSSPQAFVVQDGVSQPWVIFPDGTARATLNFAQWTTDDREYVPIGSMMSYTSGILYVVSGSEVYRSVTGRPLDFVVGINTDGDKLSDMEMQSGAPLVSFRVSYDDVSSISPSGLDVGGLVISTTRVTKFVVPNFNSLVFGEPTFDTISLFATGAINPFSIVDILGDVAFVDLTGIRSFNAVQQLKNSGQNAPFSLKIAELFDGVEQTVTCAGSFDNYDFFAVETVYGPAVVVFDELMRVFSSVDIYEGLAGIKQFAEIKTDLERKLICITTDNKFYELFSGPGLESVGFFFGERAASKKQGDVEVRVAQKPIYVKAVFTDVVESGTVSMTPYTDERSGTLLSKELIQSTIVDVPPRPLPFHSNDDRVKAVFFDISDGSEGFKSGFWMRWGFSASLLTVELACNVQSGRRQIGSQAETAARPLVQAVLAAESGSVGELVSVTGVGLSVVDSVSVGGVVGGVTVYSDESLVFFVPVGAQTGPVNLTVGVNTYKVLDTFTVV